MPDTPPFDVAAARAALGLRLATLRKAAGLTQHDLAPITQYGRSTVANVELGRQAVQRDFWVRCDDALHTGGVLAAEYDLIRPAAVAAAAAVLPANPRQSGHAGAVSLLTPGAATLDSGHGDTMSWWAPTGRFFPGVTIGAQIHPAIDDGRVVTAVPAAYASDPFVTQPGRALVIGRVEGADGPSLFGMDTGTVRSRLRGARSGTRLFIPHPYLLDEFTSAVLWAVANLDEALLSDDALLEQCRTALTGYETLPTSAASRDIAADLSPTALLFLGSAFCAGHIGRHAAELDAAPVFWTREQIGEHASTWLLFAHKNDYLRTTAQRFHHGDQHMTRVFCIPRSEVDGSPASERMLLLLAVALMESYGIEVVITDEPECETFPGFVTDYGARAIVANWVGADGIWHVDVTARRSTIREYTDAARHATAHSVIDAATGRDRLRACAGYLGLDWASLHRRCTELADTGLGGIARPRSRHLSIDGMDRACRYVAGVDGDTH